MTEYILTVKADNRETILRIVELIEGDGVLGFENIISIITEVK